MNRFQHGMLALLVCAASVVLLSCVQGARDVSGFFDGSQIDPQAFADQVLAQGIYSPSQLADPDLLELALRLAGDIVPDSDFFDDNGNIVPPPLATGQPQSVSTCGRVSRLWIRMPFHDCGTYDRKTKKGGCNGSLRLEIPTPEIAAPTADQSSPDVFDASGLQASFPGEFSFENQAHPENNGFAQSVGAFHSARQGLSFRGQPISWADAEILGGILAVFLCGGPAIPMDFGRRDSPTEDRPGMLPGSTESLNGIIKKFNRMGFSQLEMTVLVAGSHSVAAAARGTMDNTPDELDESWAQEALMFAGRRRQDGFTPLPDSICNLDNASDFDSGDLPSLASAHCIPKFTFDLAKKSQTAKYITKCANSRNFFNQQFGAAFRKMCLLGFKKT